MLRKYNMMNTNVGYADGDDGVAAFDDGVHA
jgi:hypothetical protein